MLADDWRHLAGLGIVRGRPDLAVSLFEAIERDAYVISGEPHAYAAAGADLPVIAL
jgi:hypothetical protein